ncbi:hypothetical protein CKM354_001162900 [Cercospora kikuchii]|uniref:Survival protein SurE-like phosphatase/nucleotidase domain-containing protein n=1 Tax=Cercospora kikuchii TaxID=84275 RepID=A0A9P3CXC2_9PEZI|nr:uncharacterized protein CKM354_001162900 [Cercospora kikuchii]GIZ48575.1 hypothetical protein CKM354_001162900 [Cercospora kikuchii]
MRPSTILLGVLPIVCDALNVVQSNDDGWAEINIRETYNSLSAAGYDSFISAPAENQSGTGSRDEEPEEVGDEGCQFGSCPPNSPPIGRNESEPRFNYVNSFPVTSIRHGIEVLSEEFFSGPPELAITGPNVGSNLGIVTQFSGTVGAAVEAIKLGIPAIAFSGSSGKQTAWTANVENYVRVYAALVVNVTEALTGGGEGERPFLPDGVWLNANFPKVDNRCRSPGDFKFVLSRIYPKVPFVGEDDVETCGSRRLPIERKVVGTPGCYASISVGEENKTTAPRRAQAFVLNRLKPILSCLP